MVLSLADTKVVYRRYASLFFVCGISQGDNELVTLEIIHRYVEVLDRYFGNVSASLTRIRVIHVISPRSANLICEQFKWLFGTWNLISWAGYSTSKRHMLWVAAGRSLFTLASTDDLDSRWIDNRWWDARVIKEVGSTCGTLDTEHILLKGYGP